MSKFAEYEPHRAHALSLGPADGLVIRLTTAADLPQVARIIAERDGGDAEAYLERLARDLEQIVEPPQKSLWVATLGPQVIAQARAGLFTPPEDSPPDVAPAGWYLLGVIVDPALRRRRVGDALTRARLEWIAHRSSCAYYFAAGINRATIDLHAKFGFVEVTRNFSFPGATFTGGPGVLFKCLLNSPAFRTNSIPG
jgi:ribosomal protein S18 acetylase RimI-like enzyme